MNTLFRKASTLWQRGSCGCNKLPSEIYRERAMKHAWKGDPDMVATSEMLNTQTFSTSNELLPSINGCAASLCGRLEFDCNIPIESYLLITTKACRRNPGKWSHCTDTFRHPRIYQSDTDLLLSRYSAHSSDEQLQKQAEKFQLKRLTNRKEIS